MIGMVQVLVAVVAHRRIAAHDDIGPDATDHAREVAPQRDRRLEDTILVAEENYVPHPEDTGRLARLALSDRDQALARRCVLIGAGATRRRETKRDLAALARPRGDAAGHRELEVVRMSGNAENAAQRHAEARCRAAFASHARSIACRASQLRAYRLARTSLNFHASGTI